MVVFFSLRDSNYCLHCCPNRCWVHFWFWAPLTLPLWEKVSTRYIKLEFYGDLVYRFRKIVGKSNFSEQFRKLINRYKRIGYSLDIMRQTACLVVNPIIVDGYASLFNCTTAVRAQTQWRPLRKTLTSGLGLDDMSLASPAVVLLLVFIYSGIQ